MSFLIGDAFPTASDIIEASITIESEIVVQSPKDANGYECVMPIHSSLSDVSIGAGSSTFSMGKFTFKFLEELYLCYEVLLRFYFPNSPHG